MKLFQQLRQVVVHLNFVLTNGRGQTKIIGSHFTFTKARQMKALGDILGRDPGIQSGLTPATTQ